MADGRTGRSVTEPELEVRMSKVILVGVDARDHSRDAVALGAALAQVSHAELELVPVFAAAGR